MLIRISRCERRIEKHCEASGHSWYEYEPLDKWEVSFNGAVDYCKSYERCKEIIKEHLPLWEQVVARVNEERKRNGFTLDKITIVGLRDGDDL